MTELPSVDIIFSELPAKNGTIGEIILNRPKALNSLTKEMCQLLQQQLMAWQKNASVKAVIIRGEGERAFCAGGDIRSLYQNGKENTELSQQFFRDEYKMNATIFHFNKPYIALLDGITMGGGAGVSLHGSHPIATDKLMFAMPECGIGFFPDIGAGYFLSRCPKKMGFYLGLTGARINAADMKQTGLVKHIIASDKKFELINALCHEDFAVGDSAVVTKIIDQFTVTVEPSQLFTPENQEKMSHYFSTEFTMEEIFSKLKKDHSEWAQATLKSLSEKSPTSLKVTLDQLNRAETMEFDAIMQMEYKIACQFLQSHDFYEGVRAAVIDKDQKPKWEPSEWGGV